MAPGHWLDRGASSNSLQCSCQDRIVHVQLSLLSPGDGTARETCLVATEIGFAYGTREVPSNKLGKLGAAPETTSSTEAGTCGRAHRSFFWQVRPNV